VSPALWCVLLLTLSVWNHKKLYASYRTFPDSDTILRYIRLFLCVSFLALSFPSPFNYYTRTATQANSYSACADHIGGPPKESQGGLITAGTKRLTKWRCTGACRHVWVAPPTARSFLISRLTLLLRFQGRLKQPLCGYYVSPSVLHSLSLAVSLYVTLHWWPNNLSDFFLNSGHGSSQNEAQPQSIPPNLLKENHTLL
jgi:hypothetical protein